ncbi:MAG: cyclic nucleotide-binding domain-containing protein, partial [Myxococcaceae bacterium]
PHYVAILSERVNASEDAEISSDGDQGLLVAALSAEAPDRVLHALTLLEQSQVNLRPHLPKLLAHGNERVLERGVHLSVALHASEAVPQLEAMVRSAPRRPRDEAVWALAALAPDQAGRVLPPLMESPDVGLRCAAIGALIGTQGGFAAQAALQGLAARGELAPLSERREVARLLGRLRDERWAPFLSKYLKDGDPSVRKIAIAAVGEGKYLSLARKLLPFLTWREERRNAREALASFGDDVTRMVEEAMNDRARPSALRSELPRVLRQIGTQKAFDALLFSNINDDAFLHYRIGVSLSRMHEERPKLLVDTTRVHEAIERRRRVYDELVEPYRDLRAALGDQALLTRAVGDRLDQAFALNFGLLGLLYGARQMRRVHEHFVGADSRKRAYAVELLENLVNNDDHELIKKQLHEHHRELPPGDASRLEHHFGMLCHSDDDVLRACARHTARAQRLWTLPPMGDDMSEDLVKKLFALEGVEIFAQSDVDDLTAVAALTREVSFHKGEKIWSEGDPGDALYVIVKGATAALRAGETVLTMKEREVIGDVSLLDGSPRPTDMIATEETSALMIDRRDFLDLISDRPELLKGVFRAVSQQLKKVVDLVERRSTGEIPRIIVAGEK